MQQLIDTFEREFSTYEERCRIFWDTSCISQEDLQKTVTDLDVQIQQVRVEHIKNALRDALNDKNCNLSAVNIFHKVLEMPAVETEIRFWIEEMRMIDFNHPEVWHSLSVYMGRVLRQEYASPRIDFQAASKRLRNFLSFDSPDDCVWRDAWQQQKHALLR